MFRVRALAVGEGLRGQGLAAEAVGRLQEELAVVDEAESLLPGG